MAMTRNAAFRSIRAGFSLGLLMSTFGAVTCGVSEASASELPSVVVLSTGGTIAGRGGSTTSLSEYKAGQIKGSELVEAVPEIKKYANVRVEQIVNIGSTNLTTEVWLKLANRVNEIFGSDPNVAGVV